MRLDKQEINEIRSAIISNERFVKDKLICEETIKKMLSYIDILEAMLEDPLLPLFYPPPRFPKTDFGTCSGCEHAEWRDEEYDWNIAEGYWWCNKYYEPLNSTWNDYGCNKCKECEDATKTKGSE